MGRLFDIFVLIFCNSTASRLIYAYSHYNMCAGGGCMYQISNEKFGLFVTELRKKKNLTQKDYWKDILMRQSCSKTPCS